MIPTRHRHLRTSILSLGVLALGLAGGCGPKSGASTSPDAGNGASTGSVEVGKPAPDFELKNPAGETVRLSDFRGKVVVVDFWASWCAPCKEELPVLEALYQEHGAKGLVVLGVNLDEEKDDAMGLLESTGVTFPIALDPEGSVADTYAPPKMPTSYIIDAQGNLAHVQAGYESKDAELIEERVVALLAG